MTRGFAAEANDPELTSSDQESGSLQGDFVSHGSHGPVGRRRAPDIDLWIAFSAAEVL